MNGIFFANQTKYLKMELLKQQNDIFWFNGSNNFSNENHVKKTHQMFLISTQSIFYKRKYWVDIFSWWSHCLLEDVMLLEVHLHVDEDWSNIRNLQETCTNTFELQAKEILVSLAIMFTTYSRIRAHFFIKRHGFIWV